MEKEKLNKFISIIAIVIIIIIVGVIYIISNSNNKEQKANLTNDTKQLSETQSNLEKQEESLIQDDNSNNIIGNSENENNENGIIVKEEEFSITLPKEWKNKYKIEEEKTEEGKLYYFIDILNQKDEVGGILFWIEVSDKDNEGYKDYPSYKFITSNSKYNIVALYPTDVQMDTEDSESVEEYQSMYSNIENILKTIILE